MTAVTTAEIAAMIVAMTVTIDEAMTTDLVVGTGTMSHMSGRETATTAVLVQTTTTTLLAGETMGAETGTGTVVASPLGDTTTTVLRQETSPGEAVVLRPTSRVTTVEALTRLLPTGTAEAETTTTAALPQAAEEPRDTEHGTAYLR